jgi:hypothetical protein
MFDMVNCYGDFRPSSNTIRINFRCDSVHIHPNHNSYTQPVNSFWFATEHIVIDWIGNEYSVTS